MAWIQGLFLRTKWISVHGVTSLPLPRKPHNCINAPSGGQGPQKQHEEEDRGLPQEKGISRKYTHTHALFCSWKPL